MASIYIQVRDLLMGSEKGDEWREWFQLSNRLDRRSQAILLMKKCERWSQAGLDQKRDIAGNYLAPFLFDDEELMNVIAEVDRGV